MVALTLIVWALAICLTLSSTYLALRHFERGAPHMDAPFALLPVSILKPLKGRDSGLRDNLESFFRLDYPQFELLFSVADGMDPAVPVVRELMCKYPRVRAELIVGAIDIGTNPKVNNMIRSYDRARFDWLLISDSNVRVEPDYLKKMVAHVDNGVGMVTSVVAGRSPQGIGAWLEAIYLNTFYSRGMILTDALGHPCVVGKSMLFQRSTAERFGGLRTLACYLAEDYMAGQAMQRLGLRVVIASDPISQHIGKYSVKDFWLRHLRWGRIRKAQAPVAFFFEPLLGCMVSGMLGAYGAFRFFGVHPQDFMLLHLLLWSACDTLVMRKMNVRLTASAPLAWFLREVLAYPLWIHIALGNTVNWRGRRLMIGQGGLLSLSRVAQEDVQIYQ